MPVTDPISDMLTRIRNAVQVRHESLQIPASRMKSSLLKLIAEEGFISSFEVEETDSAAKTLQVRLRYYEDKSPVIQGLKRVSKPGLRIYVGKKDIPRIYGGIGVAIISTSQGLMTGSDSWKKGVGGEFLCYIW